MGRAAVLVKSANEDKIPSVTPKKLQLASLHKFQPLTPAQEKLWDEYKKGQNLLLHGVAGTGKSFCAVYLAMQEILSRESDYEKVIIVRSAVPARDVGFLPGELDEKEYVYQLPYEAIFKEIFIPNGTPIMEKLKDQKLYNFTSTSYLRGLTFHKAIIIVDEIQNMNFHELCTVMTRLGNDCKVIFCGDFRQSDLHKQSEREGLHNFMRILDKMKEFSHVEFRMEDIVRSGLVKSFIETQVRLGLV